MSKDLTDALRALTEQANGTSPEPMKLRGNAPAAISAALPSGAQQGTGSKDFAVGGTKTMVSTDGLFALVFPDTLNTTISGVQYTVGVIKKVAL